MTCATKWFIFAIVEWYKNWFSSPYYYLLYQNRDETEAFAFIDALIAYLQLPPQARLVDVACGKGRHSRRLAEKGFDVTGIDLSASAVKEAKEFETEHLHFYQHDMRLPFHVNYFDAAFNFFTSFGYFKTRRENDNVVRTVAQSLVPGGVFVIDYLNVHYEEEHLRRSLVKQAGEVEFHISKWHNEYFFYKQIQVTDPETRHPRHLYTEKVAKFSLGDFTEMFAYQGMQLREVFGDYRLGKYDAHLSPRMIMIAKKLQ